MEQKNKELLLKDLCARLFYEVKVEYNQCACEVLSIDKFNEELTIRVCPGYCPTVKLDDIKLFLFPTSSMTEEQEREYLNTCNGYCTYYWTDETFDWFNENHFDYRHLIEKDLAIDASELNIYN